MRRAGPGDAAAIRDLTRAVYAKWVPLIGREPRPMTADYTIAVQQHWIDLHEQDGQLVGLIEMFPDGDHLWIQNLAVASSHQGSGLGGRLLLHAESVAHSAGLPELRLHTNAAFASNLAFYRRRGFIETGREALPNGGSLVNFAKRVS